jgi:hypothetical protein
VAGTLRAYVGRLGMGKSYNGVVDITKALARGQRVFSSFTVAYGSDTPKRVIEAVGPGTWDNHVNERTGELANRFRPARLHTFDGWEQLMELEDCHVVLDEAHLYAPSWDPKALPAEVRWFLSHLRKYGVDMTYITQHEDRVAKTLRDLANEVVVWQSFYLGAQWFIGKVYEPEKVKRKGEHTARLVRRKKLWLARSYDTLECSKFAGLVDPAAVRLVQELAYRRNHGIPTAGAFQSVRAELAAAEGGLVTDVSAARRGVGTSRPSGGPNMPGSLIAG